MSTSPEVRENTADSSPLLEIEDLNIHFDTGNGIAEVINGVGLKLEAGKVHGLVGESGSGKSVTSRAVMDLLPRQRMVTRTGSIKFKGREIMDLNEDQMRESIRGKHVSMVFQDPMTALNPVMRIGMQLALPMIRHFGISKKAALVRAEELLGQVGIPHPAERLRSFPHEMSGGQRQRVMIAIALACDPELLIADEPTTALDVTVQAQILDLFDRLRKERNLAILLVSHDLSLIAERCDHVSVMYAGRIVESGPAEEIFNHPEHPYTKLLEEARPSMDTPPHTVLQTIPGSPPQLVDLPPGCSFANRCPLATEICRHERPLLLARGDKRVVACHHDLYAADAVDLSAGSHPANSSDSTGVR
ncbi:ABC transporter ATP-binding protein [Glutamicibacter uratoxydans]|uniref:ABC transporter ATP-binding protein n=1 Tax=Glutamicibacter uratoxydans TaxID=43667 RepID=UPI003D6DC6ED